MSWSRAPKPTERLAEAKNRQRAREIARAAVWAERRRPKAAR